MQECLQLVVPGSETFTSGSLESNHFPGFLVASELELVHDSVCWLGDLGRLKPKVWDALKLQLETGTRINPVRISKTRR